MAGLGHCPMISKYGSSLSKAVGSVDPPFLVVKESHFDKNIHLTVSLSTQDSCQYSKTCLKQALNKRQNKDLNDKWWFNEGQKDCRMLPLEHSAIL